MAVVYVAKHQDASQVARSLFLAAEAVGGKKPRRVTDGPRAGFVIDSATLSQWQANAKSGSKKKTRKPKVKPDTASEKHVPKQKMEPVADDAATTGGDG